MKNNKSAIAENDICLIMFNHCEACYVCVTAHWAQPAQRGEYTVVSFQFGPSKKLKCAKEMRVILLFCQRFLPCFRRVVLVMYQVIAWVQGSQARTSTNVPAFQREPVIKSEA